MLNDQNQNKNLEPLGKNWPFPVHNGQRTAESQKLLDTKRFTKTKDDFSDLEEAPY